MVAITQLPFPCRLLMQRLFALKYLLILSFSIMLLAKKEHLFMVNLSKQGSGLRWNNMLVFTYAVLSKQQTKVRKRTVLK